MHQAEWKRRRLPVRPVRGRFTFAEGALVAAERLLPTYRGPDGDHEGALFLAGLERPSDTSYLAVLAPAAEHAAGSVHVGRQALLAASRAARAAGLAILGQIHSHPSGWTEHSVGDDELVLMPFEGMLSIVVAHHGRFGLRPLDSLGVHQFQDGRWVACERASIRAGLLIVPSSLDLR